MKWVLFLLSLVALFAANNALFWLPGRYDWFNFVAAAVAIPVAAVLAWFSSKRFVGGQATWKEVLTAPPAVIWFFVVVVFLFEGLTKVAAYYFAYH